VPAPAPQQQPSPGGQPTEQVVRVWTKGRVSPLYASALVLLALFFMRWLTDFLFVDVIALVVFVLGIVVAFRRKVTLTTHHLIVRRLFGTRVLPLDEIVKMRKRYIGSWNTFIPAVEIGLSNRRYLLIYSFGGAWREAIGVIARAAKAAGSPIDI
jgi:hypothetical protein